jgi:hypothetical protein
LTVRSSDFSKSDDERFWHQIPALEEKLEKKKKLWEERRQKHLENRRALWERKGTRRLDLSATPFAYVKSVDLAEGFLFEYGPEPESRAYNTPSARERFFIEHFGYRMRTGKLTQPDAQVNGALMERQFNAWLKERGVLRGRRLEVDKDYYREFIGVDDMVGNKIDEGWEWLRKRAWDKDDPLHEGYSVMLEELNRRFDYHARIQLLEAIKAPHVVERAKKHIALGRKVVLFHSRIKGGTVHPFHIFHERTGRPPSDLLGTMDTDQLNQWMASADAYNRALADFRATRADLINLEINQCRPLDLFADAFGDALTFYNGTIKKCDKVANPNAFNDDDGSVSIIAVQDEGGKEGISLHDTTGKSQRVLMNLGLPLKPTQAIQIEGRIYRVGQMSDAIFEYISTGTSFERWTFASKISQRSGTAENLALGEEARALSEAFVDAYENANSDAPSLQQGKGGKERDRAGMEAITPFEKAKTHYFGVQKNNKRRSRREGVDYFSTPEPVSFKMVEWANMRSNESTLEPSAGHGAIARYFPEDVSSTFVEPSSELLSRLALRAPGRHRQETFEDLSEAANKFHAIVMNPPYGSGGATAMAHLGKAMHHLRNGGRIVALLPEGPAANKKLENLVYGKDGERERLEKRIESKGGKGVAEEKRRLHQLDNFYVMADVGLPPVTFERAGTNVKTHVVIIDRYDDASLVPYQRGRIDLEADNVNELFDKIEGMAAPERADIPMPPAEVLAANELKVEQQGDEWILTGKTFEMKDAIKPIIKKHSGEWDQYGKRWRALSDPSEDIANLLQGKPMEGVALPSDKSAAADGSAGTAFELQQTRHAKKDIDLFVASMSARVSRDEYIRLKGIAKRHGGYFSSYKKNGAIPGFQFESEASRQAFIDAAVGGETKFSRGGGNWQEVVSSFRRLADQHDANLLNQSLVDYGLGKE